MPDAVDYLRIQDLLHLYSESVDRGAFDEVGELFRHADVYFPGDDAPAAKAGSSHLTRSNRSV